MYCRDCGRPEQLPEPLNATYQCAACAAAWTVSAALRHLTLTTARALL
jgi:hypothetical protein